MSLDFSGKLRVEQITQIELFNTEADTSTPHIHDDNEISIYTNPILFFPYYN